LRAPPDNVPTNTRSKELHKPGAERH